MFPAFLLGVLLLVGLYLLAQWFVRTEPKAVVRTLYWLAGLLILAAGVFLVLTGRLGWALAALGATLPWVVRAIRWTGVLGGGRGSARKEVGRSEVTSRYLRMKLDHATGAMTGEVLAGPLTGRLLDDLSDGELRDLAVMAAGDPDSQALLETWLDRERPGWRDAGDSGTAGAGRGGPGDGRMSRGEALSILGLEDPVDEAIVRAAYRRLMRQTHPDHGGSAWMAAKVNEARDVLLGGRS
jgi:hypothetical protein